MLQTLLLLQGTVLWGGEWGAGADASPSSSHPPHQPLVSGPMGPPVVPPGTACLGLSLPVPPKGDLTCMGLSSRDRDPTPPWVQSHSKV